MNADYTFTPSEITKEVISLLEVGLKPFITSAPGLGKSALMAQVARTFKLKLIDIRLSQAAPEDFMGLPFRSQEENRAEFATFRMFPTENDKIPTGYNGWLLFLDEFNSANRAVLSAAYKVIHDKMVGMEKLHPDVYIVLAGNREEDNAIVNDIGTALQSRVVTLPMVKSLKDFMRYAYKAGFDSRVLGFLDAQPDLLHQFDPNHEDLTFACPRTWEFVSKYIQGKSFNEINVKTLCGMVSQGPAIAFYAFLKEFDRIPNFNDILANPDTVPVPVDDGTQWATISMMLAKFDDKNFGDLSKYIRRFAPEMQIVFFRGAANRDSRMTRHPDFKNALKQLKEFIYDDDDDGFTATTVPAVGAAA